MNRITDERNCRIKNVMHKTSRKIYDLLKKNIEIIVIGNAQGWKQDINLEKKNNHNFVKIHFSCSFRC